MRYFVLSLSITVLALAFAFSHSNIASAGTMQLPCNLLIEKEEIPNTGREFYFFAEKLGVLQDDFYLQGGESTDYGIDIDNTITIREDVPEGYTLNIECTEGFQNCGSEIFEPCLRITPLEDGTGVVAFCEDNDEGRCVFTNVLSATEVPTLSEWGLAAMAGVLGLIAFITIRRKKAVA